MGVAVAVLSILGRPDTKTAITMLAIGLACAGVSLLEKAREGRRRSEKTKEVIPGDGFVCDW